MKSIFIWLLIIALLVFGEIRCIYKAVTCNWEPIGKAEIIYTGSGIAEGRDLKDKSFSPA